MFFVPFICVLCLNQIVFCEIDYSEESSTYELPATLFHAEAINLREPRKYPWLSAFLSRQSRKYFCTGSLISAQHILSGRSKITNIYCCRNFKAYYALELENFVILQLHIASTPKAGKKLSQMKL